MTNHPKRQLRKRIRAELAQMPEEVKAWLSDELMQKLEQHPQFRQAGTVLMYYSLPDEVCTHRFIDSWYREKRILLPVINGEDLKLCLYDGPNCLSCDNSFHVAEPTGQPFTAYDEINLAVIPGLAFDLAGRRLGRGKGYYDHLLPRLTHTHLLGLCFPCQLVEAVPTESHDASVDEVLSVPPRPYTL